jgi:hypothetical protein
LNRVSPIFSQLVHLVPRSLFAELVDRLLAERHARGFSSWAQCTAMIFCQLADAQSLREVVQGLAAAQGNLRHLCLTEAPSRSTLSYANQHRAAGLFEELFVRLPEFLRHQLPGRLFDFKHKLASIDSTLTTVCARSFPWAKYRRSKGSIKVHLLLDHVGHMPTYAVMSEGNKSDFDTEHNREFVFLTNQLQLPRKR